MNKKPTGETETMRVLTEFVDWTYGSDPTLPQRGSGSFDPGKPSEWALWVRERILEAIVYEYRSETNQGTKGSASRARALAQAYRHVSEWEAEEARKDDPKLPTRKPPR